MSYLLPACRHPEYYRRARVCCEVEDCMLGIVLTLLAVMFVLAVAFYFSDHPGARSHPADPLFFDRPGRNKRAPR